MNKIVSKGETLGKFIKEDLFYGIKTGCNEAFIITETKKKELIELDPKSSEMIKPLLMGRDLKRYKIPVSNNYLIFSYHGIDISQYPAILNHLKEYEHKLKKKAGNQKWYELQSSPKTLDRFTNPKILYQEIATFSSFTIDLNGFFTNNKIFQISSEDLSLLGFLNSKLVWFYLGNIVSKLQGGAYAMQSPYIFIHPYSTKDSEKY
jgi:adenine-specific DNA-methyltransferase